MNKVNSNLVILAFIVLVIGGLFCYRLWMSLMDQVNNPYDRPIPTQRERCQQNLRHLDKALALYSIDHEGTYPPTLKSLIPQYVDSTSLFICPVSGHSVGNLSNVNEWTDYTYYPPSTKDPTPKTILAYCDPTNHPSWGTILFFDGIVETYEGKQFREILKTTVTNLLHGNTDATTQKIE